MQTVWTFKTRNYTIAFEIDDCIDDPVDSFSEEEDVTAIREGAVAWFDARVSVYKNGHRIGADTLGCCAYKDATEFYTSHRDKDPMSRNCSIMRAARGGNVSIGHYFPDMVRQAIADARATITQ